VHDPDLAMIRVLAGGVPSGKRRIRWWVSRAGSGATPAFVRYMAGRAPNIGGLGNEAHGGQGLGRPWRCARDSGGLELTVDLGFGSSNEQYLAAEKTLARPLLARLPGRPVA
jgi:hypothetical protein